MKASTILIYTISTLCLIENSTPTFATITPYSNTVKMNQLGSTCRNKLARRWGSYDATRCPNVNKRVACFQDLQEVCSQNGILDAIVVKSEQLFTGSCVENYSLCLDQGALNSESQPDSNQNPASSILPQANTAVQSWSCNSMIMHRSGSLEFSTCDGQSGAHWACNETIKKTCTDPSGEKTETVETRPNGKCFFSLKECW